MLRGTKYITRLFDKSMSTASKKYCFHAGDYTSKAMVAPRDGSDWRLKQNNPEDFQVVC